MEPGGLKVQFFESHFEAQSMYLIQTKKCFKEHESKIISRANFPKLYFHIVLNDRCQLRLKKIFNALSPQVFLLFDK